MGRQDISKLNSERDKRAFTNALLNDINALDSMLANKQFENDIIRIGAEQELVLVSKDWSPALNYDVFIKEAKEPLLTTELGRFNLEINLPPFEFKSDAFQKMESTLREKLNRLQAIGNDYQTKILLTGILPTISWDYLNFNCMTPNPRYEALNQLLKDTRNSNFQIHIKGLDELLTAHPNILFEACNTSFQVHLQIPQDKFVERYNWSQLIAGPVLAAACNSPLLMGKRLWNETRIALFQQSIDIRNSDHIKREVEPRVTFGKNWLYKSVSELYKENIAHFNPLILPNKLGDSMESLSKGEIPKLHALCLHNGTIYSWNRACYGISDTGKPHLRIENRYLASGPTVIDEMANMAFWTGLMMGMPSRHANLQEQMPFDKARQNFYKAAQYGLDANLKWFDETISAQKLILEKLLPWAHEGLNAMNIDREDVQKYLGIIEQRVKLKQTGAKWTQRNFTTLLEKSTSQEANTGITRALHDLSWKDEPVHKWPPLEINLSDSHKHFYTVSHLMKTDLTTVREDDILNLATNVMIWKNIRYIMVENEKHQLKGIISTRLLVKKLKEGWDESLLVKDLMESDLVTVSLNTSTSEAIKIMIEKNIGCLPVVSQKKLVGLITERDILSAAHLTQKFHLHDE